VARLRRVDREAAEDLFNAYYPRLAGWVRRLVDDDDTAHEIASEAFTRLLARWSGLDDPQSYLYMIAANLVRHHWRKSGPRAARSRRCWPLPGSRPLSRPGVPAAQRRGQDKPIRDTR
jgi:RNA polymerase sigma-70 factor (ECF subfamily)